MSKNKTIGMQVPNKDCSVEDSILPTTVACDSLYNYPKLSYRAWQWAVSSP